MSWLSRKPEPKEHSEVTEDDGLIEINRLYDSEQSVSRIGEKHAKMIQAHHVKEAIHVYANETGEVVTWDSKADRYTLWRGTWR